MITPASPWIGSTRNPTVFGPIAAANASKSPNGTMRKPAGKGPKPSRFVGSVENPTMAIVRPWKLRRRR